MAVQKGEASFAAVPWGKALAKGVWVFCCVSGFEEKHYRFRVFEAA
jgi:hypothetical protein